MHETHETPVAGTPGDGQGISHVLPGYRAFHARAGRRAACPAAERGGGNAVSLSTIPPPREKKEQGKLSTH